MAAWTSGGRVQSPKSRVQSRAGERRVQSTVEKGQEESKVQCLTPINSEVLREQGREQESKVEEGTKESKVQSPKSKVEEGKEARQSSTFNFRLSTFPRLVWEKLPFFAVSFVFCIITLLAQGDAGAIQTATRFPMSHRVANAMLSYVHYLVQMVWPGHYAVFYSYPRGFSTAAVSLAVGLLLSLSILAWKTFHKRPYFAFGWIWYVVTLLPVIGLIQVGSQSHADRYTYVPLIGIFIVLAWGAYDAVDGSAGETPALPGFHDTWLVILAIAAGVVTLLCTALARQQIGYETLFRHAIAVTTRNELARHNLAMTLGNQGRLDEAIAQLEEAVRLAPDYALAHGNLGAMLLKKGRLEESILHSQAAIKLRPNFAGAHRNLGAALGAKGRVDEAIVELKEAVRLAPGDPEARYNLGFALASKGRWDEAIVQYRELVRLQPANPSAQKLLNAAPAAARNSEGGSPKGEASPKLELRKSP